MKLCLAFLEAYRYPDVVGYSAAVSACEKGQRWEMVLALMVGMLHRCVSAVNDNYNVAIQKVDGDAIGFSSAIA